MPVWLSQMFLWVPIIVTLGYAYDEQIEAFLDKIISKIKETKKQ